MVDGFNSNFFLIKLKILIVTFFFILIIVLIAFNDFTTLLDETFMFVEKKILKL